MAQNDVQFDAWVQDKMSGHEVSAPEPSAAMFGIVPDAPVATPAGAVLVSKLAKYAAAAAAGVLLISAAYFFSATPVVKETIAPLAEEAAPASVVQEAATSAIVAESTPIPTSTPAVAEAPTPVEAAAVPVEVTAAPVVAEARVEVAVPVEAAAAPVEVTATPVESPEESIAEPTDVTPPVRKITLPLTLELDSEEKQ